MSPPDSNAPAVSALTRQFIAGIVEAKSFGHLEHVKVAYELLATEDFLDAACLYVRQIRVLANNAGAPEKFNLTITLAYMSLIAERMGECEVADFDHFLTVNPDLLSKTVLLPWYSHARLNSQRAREQFLLPDVCSPDQPTV